MPRCRVDYERSEVREFVSDQYKGHKFVKVMFIPTNLGIAERFGYTRKRTEFPMTLMPFNKETGKLDETLEKLLIETFEQRKFGESDVARIEVPIPPTLMTYLSDGKNHKKGDPIMAGNMPRVYTSLELVTFTEKVNGVERAIDMNNLISRALAMREQHIEDASWYEAEEVPTAADDDANVIDELPEEVAAPNTTQKPNPFRR